MLARYSMERGRKLADYPKRVREGMRQDTRKHTKHVLRPDADAVARYLAAPDAAAWAVFRAAYLEGLAARFAADRQPFDRLAALAEAGDVYLGCSCPSAANPDVMHCHTVLALAFMQKRYPQLKVEFPKRVSA